MKKEGVNKVVNIKDIFGRKGFTVLAVCLIFMISALAGIFGKGPEKAVAAAENKLKITVENANVAVKLSEDGKFHYKYQRSLYIVKRKRKDSAVVIDVKKREGKDSGKEKNPFINVEIYIPDKQYTNITGITKKGGLSMPSINANITIKNYSGSASLNLPSEFNKKVSYIGRNGSGSIVMDGDSKFIIDVEISNSSLSTFWGGDSAGEAIYKYQQGGGKKRAKIQLDLEGCAFSVEKQ